MATPWMTTDDLISAVKRKISFPISQNTFSEDDIIQFANEEMFIAQVPSVLQYHEEYFVYRVQVPLVSNVSRYTIPDRAIGMKLRDVMWSDSSGNYFEMTRISADDKAFFQRNIGANQAIHKFYIEGNDIVLTPSVVGGPTGALNFFFFLRPNQLVANSRARIIESFQRTVSVPVGNLNPGDLFSIVVGYQTPNPTQYNLTAVAAAPGANEYLIGANATATAANLATAINGLSLSNVTASASSTLITSGSIAVVPISPAGLITLNTGTNHGLSNGTIVEIAASTTTPSINGSYVISNVTSNTFDITIANPITIAGSCSYTVNSGNIQITFQDITLQLSEVGQLSLSSQIGFNFDSALSTLFAVGDKIDLLQTKPGHRTYIYDVVLQAISGSTGFFNYSDLLVYLSTGFGFTPQIINMQIGDYMCLANEAIIPQIPPDLHNVLAERTAARILAAIGDQAGLAITNQKIAEMENRQGNLLDQRSEGTPLKITARHSLLRFGKMGVRRRM